MHPYQVAPSRPVSSSNSSGTSPKTPTAPQVLTPANPSTVNKPLAPMPGSVQTPAISINKTWVLPPKPKPGRKPAVDTPPTKRKAQNREAQRAFRERRAAKVGELEEDMKKMEEEDAKEQEVLRERIQQLESNVEEYTNMLEAWRERFNEMQTACERERQMRETAEIEVQTLKERMSGGTEAVPLPPRRNKRNNPTEEHISQVPEMSEAGEEKEDAEQVPITCGRCSNDTRCQCIEEAFEMGNITEDPSAPAFKRPHSPQSNSDNKRPRHDFNDNSNTEIDFTAQFSTLRPPTLTTSSSTASSSIPATAPPDPCGFCSDGTPCICAEISKESLRHQDARPPSSLPVSSRQQITNGPTTSNPCANGPGTCAQCISNPTSTLFCKSVAANRSLTTDKTQLNSSAPPPGPTLTCADAFTTLSRHPAFSAATDEFNTWVPQLTAIPKTASAPERTAYDIEAASVMSVLKLFDRRFGSQGEKITEEGM